jgi:hypothetical protein
MDNKNFIPDTNLENQEASTPDTNLKNQEQIAEVLLYSAKNPPLRQEDSIEHRNIMAEEKMFRGSKSS